MKMTVTVPREVDAKYLQCYILPMYWEDSEFNNQADDSKGSLFRGIFPLCVMSKEHMIRLGVPECYADKFIRITIDLDNGTVKDWSYGTSASFGYKSCDMNIFILTDPAGNTIYRTPEGDTEYVIGPKFMNDYGDYFVLQVDEEGKIKNWDQKKMIAALQIWMGEVC